MNPRQLDQIGQDIERLVGEAEAAATGAGNEGKAALRQLRERLAVVLDGARSRLDDVQYGVRDAARTTDRYVHDQPWPVIGAALVVGVVAGLLISRR
jgi:ElaB/YqjD/DUF883 family membrane-anchored ribosome-binding protein